MTSRKTLEDRLELGDIAIEELKGANPEFEMFHGVYAGVTANPDQILEVVEAYDEHRETDKRIVGLKMFAGHSTGNMGLIKEEEQRLVYKTLAELDYRGVLAVHCEKEPKLRPGLWNPDEPFTHTLARPPRAEVDSVRDQIAFAKEAGYKGTLHICHISTPEALEVIEAARGYVDFKITTEITPHHAVMYDEMMKGEEGLLLKMNPPLRTKEMQEYMLQALIDGRIDVIGTDHAPHTLNEKIGLAKDKEGKPIYASGIPGLPYYPIFIEYLRERGMTENRINAVTHDNVVSIFGLEGVVSKEKRKPVYNLANTYEFDAFKDVRNA
jgi:dihydroorotase